jgi:DNA-binding transcriptional ArsR family regulator
MSHFTLRYLRRLYEAFDGDLALAIVLGEIAHHTVVNYFSSRGPDARVAGKLTRHALEPALLASCSATALARATGLARETVRRKIIVLEARGWIERATERRVRIVPAVADHFFETFNVDVVEALLETADRVRALLQEKRDID